MKTPAPCRADLESSILYGRPPTSQWKSAEFKVVFTDSKVGRKIGHSEDILLTEKLRLDIAAETALVELMIPRPFPLATGIRMTVPLPLF